MKYSRLWISAAIIAIVILISFALSVPRAYDGIELPESVVAPTTPLVAIRDTFKKGSHTITGSIETPNACTSIHAETSYNASSTEGILIAISMPKDTGVCLEMPTIVKFSTIVDAPAGLPIVVQVNGRQASTTSL